MSLAATWQLQHCRTSRWLVVTPDVVWPAQQTGLTGLDLTAGLLDTTVDMASLQVRSAPELYRCWHQLQFDLQPPKHLYVAGTGVALPRQASVHISSTPFVTVNISRSGHHSRRHATAIHGHMLASGPCGFGGQP
jgi:hypothetical protein